MKYQGYGVHPLPNNKDACDLMNKHGGYWRPWKTDT